MATIMVVTMSLRELKADLPMPAMMKKTGIMDADEDSRSTVAPSTAGGSSWSRNSSPADSDAHACPLRAFFARRAMGLTPSGWIEPEEEDSEDDEIIASMAAKARRLALGSRADAQSGTTEQKH
mmetsp:Transcript_28071/g.45026  ORF Transcript_28071/g.45026 Transcript_28071/m.45026 type:complete len:124 (+) Transcript_28071:82-453(+)